MRSFDYLSRGSRAPGFLRFVSVRMADGTLGVCLACTVILAAAWALEAEHLRRALLREEVLSRVVERGRIAGAQSARRRLRAQNVTALMHSLDTESRSGAEEARRLTELANALPQKTWLSALSESNADYSLEGGALGLAELGRALGALSRVPHVREAVLVEAAPAAREGLPEALRYRMRIVWGPP